MITDKTYELLKEPILQDDGSIVFTSRSVELIHEIAEMCNAIPITKNAQKHMKEYTKNLPTDSSAEQVYLDMLALIANSVPSIFHAKMLIKMFMPIISRKPKEQNI